MTCYIADDDPLIRSVYADIFTERGYRVEVFSDGRSLLGECCCRLPDLVILDVEMPGINGIDCCRRIRQLPGGEDIAVIINSGCPEGEWSREIGRCGASGFLRKPVSADRLAAIAGTIIS